MKKILILLASSLFAMNLHAFSANQNSLNGLGTVYGYLAGQEITLQNIESSHPELKQDVVLARLQFDASYGNAREKTKNKIIELFKGDGTKLIAMLEEKIAEQLPKKIIPKNEAIAFIKTVQNRANGIIENQPTRDFLLAITYFENPGLEIAEKKTQKFNTKNEPKAKGLDLNVTLPLSWKEQEGTTPNTVRSWKSEGGSGASLISLLVRDTGDTRTKAQVQRAIERKELTNMVHPSADVNKVIYSEVGNQPGWYAEAELTQKRLEFEIFQTYKNLQVLYGGKTIEIGCSSGNIAAKKDEALKEAKRVESLCKAVMLSLVINNLYQ
jgi:hypothetical protein